MGLGDMLRKANWALEGRGAGFSNDEKRLTGLVAEQLRVRCGWDLYATSCFEEMDGSRVLVWVLPGKDEERALGTTRLPRELVAAMAVLGFRAEGHVGEVAKKDGRHDGVAGVFVREGE